MSGLDVLILNWRDLRHPRAGGAEVLTQGHASRLVERGHRVTMFVGAAEGAAREEVTDGVRVVRVLEAASRSLARGGAPEVP